MPETKSMTFSEKAAADKEAADKEAADKVAADKAAADKAKATSVKAWETKSNLDAKPVEPAATQAAPYPSQAEADAIKDGTYLKKRDAAPEVGSAEYKTR